MKSRTTERFRSGLKNLPSTVRQQTRQVFRLWLENPRHPSLRFKRLNTAKPVYSVRIGGSYRALAVIEDDTAIRFWIGSHADFDRLIKRL